MELQVNKNILKFLIKEVIKESRERASDEEEEKEKELTWKKVTDNLTDEGFRLVVLKALTNANSTDSEFMSDMFETLTSEEDKEVQQIIINHIEKIYKQSDL